MRIGADCAAPTDKSHSLAQHVQRVRTGNNEIHHVRLADGRVLRCEEAALPDGGRMISYIDITDHVRVADSLRLLAITDDLTGLFNRRHFMDLLQRELARFERYRRPLSLAMLDVDHFKQVNDNYGHATGDIVLKSIASRCQATLRDSDTIARVGGEEFAILMSETSLADAQAVADRLREHVATTPIRSNNDAISVTVSLGVADPNPPLRTVSDLLGAADRALYEAKTRGRNRVVTFSNA